MRKLTVRLPDDVYDQLAEYRKMVREDGHKPPTLDTLVGALIESGDGWGNFEIDVLVPYRVAHPQVA